MSQIQVPPGSDIGTAVSNWEVVRATFRTKGAKIGLLLVASVATFGEGLDLFHKGETLYKIIHDWKDFVEVIGSGWFQTLVIVVGLALIFWKAVVARNAVRPPTQGERIDALEYHKKEVCQPALAALKATDERYEKAFDDLMKTVTDLIALVGSNQETSIKRFEGLSNLTTSHISQISDLERAVRSLTTVSTGLPLYVQLSLWLFELQQECDRSLAEYEYLRRTYGEIQPATRPFSNWRSRSKDGSQLDEAFAAWERWATYLEDHVGHCQQFYARNSLAPAEELFGFVNRWRVEPSDLASDNVKLLIRAHCRVLGDIQKNLEMDWKGQAVPPGTVQKP